MKDDKDQRRDLSNVTADWFRNKNKTFYDRLNSKVRAGVRKSNRLYTCGNSSRDLIHEWVAGAIERDALQGPLNEGREELVCKSLTTYVLRQAITDKRACGKDVYARLTYGARTRRETDGTIQREVRTGPDDVRRMGSGLSSGSQGTQREGDHFDTSLQEWEAFEVMSYVGEMLASQSPYTPRRANVLAKLRQERAELRMLRSLQQLCEDHPDTLNLDTLRSALRAVCRHLCLERSLTTLRALAARRQEVRHLQEACELLEGVQSLPEHCQSRQERVSGLEEKAQQYLHKSYRYGRVLWLLYEESSNQEIGEVLGVSAKRARNIVHSLRKRIRQFIKRGHLDLTDLPTP